MNRFILAVVAIVIAMHITGSARAQLCSGVITGSIKHAQRGGNWCDSNLADPSLGGNMNCQGSFYTLAAVSTSTIPGDITVNRGLPEIPFSFINTATQQTVAQGVTDVNGNFTVQWVDFSNACQGPMPLAVAIFMNHAGGRFLVSSPNILFAFFPFILTTNNSFPFARAESIAAEVNFGTWDVPNPITNVYSSAFKAWNNVLKISGRMQSTFVNVPIAFPSSSCGGSSSCTECDEDERAWVHINNSDALDTFVVTHELGHAATCAAHTAEFSAYFDYSRDGSSHGLFTQEFRSVTFEEGFASLIATNALWSEVNPLHPRLCLGAPNAPCTVNSFHGECVDHAFSAMNPCTTTPDRTRQEATVTAFLWDLIDAPTGEDDGSIFHNVENIDQSSFDLLSTLDEYPQGYDNHEENEPVCCAFWFCGACGTGILGNGSDRDNGRNIADFLFRWPPFTSAQAHTMNCTP